MLGSFNGASPFPCDARLAGDTSRKVGMISFLFVNCAHLITHKKIAKTNESKAKARATGYDA
jgi:hypothetical protein